MKLIAEWRKAWKMFSIHAAVICGVAPEIYENVDVVQDYLSASAFHHLSAFLAVLVIVGRLVKQ